ncbi:MAG: BatA domain-containing protein, partial [Amylibacter sp.]
MLPILWWLLRAVPPAPVRTKFPGILLLLGLKDKETTPDRTPWWLLALRIVALGAAIIGFAGPVLNPLGTVASQNKLVILMDASWASADDWGKRQDKLVEILQAADQDNRPTVLFKLSDMPQNLVKPNFIAPNVYLQRASNLVPNAWIGEYSGWIEYFNMQNLIFDTVWISDGLADPDRDGLLEVLVGKGDVTIVERADPVFALTPPGVKDGNLVVEVQRSWANGATDLAASAMGPDPNGVLRVLGSSTAQFPPKDTSVELLFEMPSDLRNRITSVSLGGQRSAGGVVVTGDTVQRRKVAIISASSQQEVADLISEEFYLRKALAPTADVIETDLKNTLLANPDVMIFVDVGKLSASETKDVSKWVDEGGLLVRFAGARLAASKIGLNKEHPLLPVRLRAGGRSVGGAMSWGAPKKLHPFVEGTAFYGLDVPEDVTISSQVIAQPDPNLAERVVASL